ncbi:aerolysin-like protein [Anneissia japonica]|uniref:aerolysin-like protein n=1 Tax=Anneissia japonica TaxID=1529436 RepID=UPI00142555D9|nr:aerolysin-like protein [Anneissia japonica]
MPRLVTDTSIDLDYFTCNKAAGDSGGKRKEFIKLREGAVMTKIQAWKENWLVRGIKMWMSDGSSMLFGHQQGDTSTFTISEGEKITELFIQSSGKKAKGYYRFGGFGIKTDKGKNWKFLCSKLKDEDRYWPYVGSGLMCGMFGRTGDDVDCLGFALLRPVKTAYLKDVSYPGIAFKTVDTPPTTVASTEYYNNTDVDQSYELSASASVTTVRSWSVTTGIEFGMDVNVVGGIPMVAEVDTTFSWKISADHTYIRSTSKTEEYTWKWPIICPAQSKILASGTMYHDMIDHQTYEANLHIELDNGKEYDIHVNGKYKGINVRNGILSIEEIS